MFNNGYDRKYITPKNDERYLKEHIKFTPPITQEQIGVPTEQELAELNAKPSQQTPSAPPSGTASGTRTTTELKI